MSDQSSKTIVVCGATGRQGSAVVRHLIVDGWRVVGVTRDAQSSKANSVAKMGAEMMTADMSDRAALDRAFAGAYGVYNVQNPMISGFKGEVEQGKNVAEAAKSAKVEHVVYGAAGIGKRTGVPSWDTKVEIQEHMQRLGLPLTVLRPNAFMELMTDKAYYPAAAIWHVMVKLMGGGRNVPWLAVEDQGAIAAAVFRQPSTYLGRELQLGSDVRTLDEARTTWTEVFGKPPRKFPMPVWIFQRVAGHAGKDLPIMWRWLRTHEIPEDTAPTHEIHPGAMDLRAWMEGKRAEQAAKV